MLRLRRPLFVFSLGHNGLLMEAGSCSRGLLLTQHALVNCLELRDGVLSRIALLLADLERHVLILRELTLTRHGQATQRLHTLHLLNAVNRFQLRYEMIIARCGGVLEVPAQWML